MTDAQGPDPFEVIQVDVSAVIAHDFTSNPDARAHALDMVYRDLRDACGGVAPIDWESRVTYTPSSYGGLRVRWRGQALKHKHYLRKQHLGPGLWREVCIVARCEYQGEVNGL